MFGRYRLDRLIREGDTTEVYEASVLGAGGFVRKVALKRLKQAHAGDPAQSRVFEAEARLVSRVHHANVVGVLDFGTMEGQPYQVLEHVDGLDLSRLESRARAARAAVGASLWVAILTEAAHGLDHVHNLRDETGQPLGIVHRDVAPANILIAWSGDVKLADFGRALSHSARDSTEPSAPRGELELQSPEQQRGERVDARADVFSLGCLLQRLLATDAKIPDELSRLIAHAVAPDVTRRMSSAAMFAEGCTRWLATQGIVDGRSVVRDTMSALARALEAASAPHGRIAALVDVGALLGEGESSRHETELPFAPTHGDFADETELVPPLAARGPPPAPPASAESAFADITDKSDGNRADSVTVHVDPPSDVITGDEVLRPPADYQILEPIAEGGFAQVFRARHVPTDEIVAMKILHHERRDNLVSAARFDREVGALAEIVSPYLVKLRDSGRLDDGRPWMAMELLDGQTLAHAIVASGGPMPPARIRRLARDLAMGLASLHAADLVHRDLGARNVMVVPSRGTEKAMIIDLGHARWLDERPRTKLTEPGLVLGNARWMAPEQIHAPSKVGPAADLYSLGLLILAMTTGRAPFTGSPASVLVKQLDEVPEIPPGPFSALIRRLIEKDPARRWSNASAVAAELHQIPLPRDHDTAPAEAVDRTMPLGAKAVAPKAIPTPLPARRPSGVFVSAVAMALIAGVLLAVLTLR